MLNRILRPAVLIAAAAAVTAASPLRLPWVPATLLARGTCVVLVYGVLLWLWDAHVRSLAKAMVRDGMNLVHHRGRQVG